MASFTSTPTQFNPYVSQLPIVEEMSKVGMEKQAKYDQGIQKIQTQIDNVAGLDVMRDVDKQYLTSKMNQLGNNLKTVAAGDFSNYQLVNTVGGMVNQIGKDDTIQNAVYSTVKVRKALSERDTANKTGKGAVENDWWLDKSVNSYLNNTDQKASFSGGYIPFTDVTKKMIDVIKTLHEQGSDEDIPWVIDANGQPIMGQTADAMIEKIHKGITSPQIANAIRASLDENDIRQLDISGQYHFKDTTPDNLVQYAIQKTNQDISKVQDNIDKLKVFATTKQGDPVIYNQTLGVIQQLENSIAPDGQYASQLNSDIQQARNNPEQVKASLYKNEFINQLAIGHAWDDAAVKVIANPIRAQLNSNREFALNQSRFGLEQKKEAFDEQYKMEDLKIKQEDFQLKKDKQAALGKSHFTIQAQGLADKNLNYETETATKIDAIDQQLAGIKGEVLEALRGELIRQNIDPNSSTYKALFNSNIDLKDEHAIDHLLDNIYSTDPAFKAKFSAKFQPIIEKYHDQFTQKQQYQNKLVFADKMANSKMLSSEDYKDLQKDLANRSNITVADNTGKSYTITPEEQFNFAVKARQAMSAMTNLSSLPPQLQAQEHERILNGFTPAERILFTSSYNTKLRGEYDKIISKSEAIQDQKNKEKNTQIAKLSPELVPEQGMFDNIDKPDVTKNRDFYENLVKNKIAGNVEQSAKNPEYDNTLNKWFADSKISSRLSYGFRRDASGYFITITDGTGFQKVRIDDSEARQIGITMPISVTIQQDMLANGGTTNTMNGSPKGARFQNVGGVKNSHVVGDLESAVGDPNTVYPRLQIPTTNGWKEWTSKEGMTLNNGLEYLQDGRLNDAYVEEIFRKAGIISKTDQILTK